MLNKDMFIRKMAEETGRTLTETKAIVNDMIDMIQKAYCRPQLHYPGYFPE